MLGATYTGLQLHYRRRDGPGFPQRLTALRHLVSRRLSCDRPRGVGVGRWLRRAVLCQLCLRCVQPQHTLVVALEKECLPEQPELLLSLVQLGARF